MNPYASIEADFKTTPYDHQLREFEQSCDMRARALFWQMRTGKTKLTIDTAFYNFKKGRIRTMIVFAPNGVHSNWVKRELPIHAWYDNWTGWDWRTDLKDDPEHWAQFDQAVKSDGLAVFCFAAATVTRPDVKKAVKRILTDRGGVMFVADESHDYRVPGAKRTGYARWLAEKCIMRRILSGTPVENSPLHAFSQFELLKKRALGYQTFADFKNRYAKYKTVNLPDGRSFPKLEEYTNLEELRDRMARYASVVLRSDCHDLPELVFNQREVEITPEQVRVFEELKHSLLIDLESGTVSVGEQKKSLIKMQQVLSGFLKDEYGEVHDIVPDEQNPRLIDCLDEVNLTGGRCIIWCAFREDMDRVSRFLRKDGHEVLEYHGRTKAVDKAKARKEFEPGSHGVSHLVGHPVSGGSGLDLSAADKIIWYSHTFDAIVRSQADERATAMGGGNVPVVDLTAGRTDDYVRNNVKNKVDVATSLSREGLKKVLR